MGLAKFIEERTHLSEIFQSQMVDYKVPKNLTFPYAFGVLAIIAFTVQILSGMILLMYYKPYDTLAFDSAALFIWKVIPYGWLFRSIHAAGANFFLAVVYLHMFTGIYYNAYKKPRELVWVMGFIIYFLLLLTALTGYV
ncbi:MAG: cytochrome b N-terminal domain-containing protein, partial [Hydrogenobaculum sp.]